MKTIAIIILLIYQILLFIFQIKCNDDFSKEISEKTSLVVALIPIAMCIILAI